MELRYRVSDGFLHIGFQRTHHGHFLGIPRADTEYRLGEHFRDVAIEQLEYGYTQILREEVTYCFCPLMGLPWNLEEIVEGLDG